LITRTIFAETYGPQRHAGSETVFRYTCVCVFCRRRVLAVMNRWIARPSEVTQIRTALPAATTNK
jgi:hypothetical protein